MEKFSDLQEKEVINICDGSRLGYVSDLELELPTGRIVSLLIPTESERWNFFCRQKMLYVPWRCIKRIGEDIILVEVDADALYREEE